MEKERAAGAVALQRHLGRKGEQEMEVEERDGFVPVPAQCEGPGVSLRRGGWTRS